MFPCLSQLVIINSCPKPGLPCLPSLKHLAVRGCNNGLLRSISTFYGLTHLNLSRDNEGITSFPEGMFTNLTFLKTLTICDFPKLKELPNEPFNLALEHLSIIDCCELESLPEQIWESLQSLQLLNIWNCKGLRCLPEEGIQNLTSLETLSIQNCKGLRCLPEALVEECKKRNHLLCGGTLICIFVENKIRKFCSRYKSEIYHLHDISDFTVSSLLAIYFFGFT
ncbi:hypothetical protein P8452_48472 [Trifolium repens]|nr:hypothetical protein P8452_48472 [Trifolium repens]